jgi:hypothetical protein
MGIKFLEQKTILGFKIEGTPYTAETLVSADYFLRAENIKVSPNLAMLERNHGTGAFGKEQAIPGSINGEISFRVYMAPANAANTEPGCFIPLKATIEKQVVQEGTAPKALVTKLAGCTGDVTLVEDAVGNPVAMDFVFKGLFSSITMRNNASLCVFTPKATDLLPPPVLSSIMTCHSQIIDFDKVSIKVNNDVQFAQLPGNASGYEGSHVVDRNPMVTIDPYANDLGSYDWYQETLSAGLGSLEWAVGSTVPMKIIIDKLQSNKVPDYGARNKMTVANLELSVRGNEANDWEDEIEILHGSKT